jgi:type VI secretion system protein VasI
LGIFLTVMAVSASAHAAPADCIKIENELDRLACYDKDAGRASKVSTISASSGSPWSVKQETSKLTDQTTVIMSINSDEGVNCGWNKGSHISLVTRCMEGKTVLYFDTGCHMTSSEYSSYGNITYRLDSENALTVKGDASTDHKALGLWNAGKSIPVIKRMLGKSRMLVRMMAYGESPFTATFNISKLEDSIKPLRQACKW